MITVNYLDGVDNIRCDEHLFQWDNGQKLCLSGLNTYVSNLETVDVHFCNKISKLAITVKPTVVSNNIVAPIPNSLLQDPYPIIAYFYVPSDNGSRTIVMVTIPIEPKKRPSDFILNEDEAIASLDAINNKVNTTLNNITVDYNNFKTNIEAELRDMVENLELEDAKTLQSHPPTDFVQTHSYSYNGYDCNTLYDAGLYLCSGNTTNTPNDLIYGSLFVMPYRRSYGNTKPDYCAQIFIPNGDVSDPSLFYRTSLENTWNEWKKSCDAGNADTLDNLHANSFALKTEIPTSLPASGGNADYATNAGNAGNADYATNAGNAEKLNDLTAERFFKTNYSSNYDCNTLYDAGLYLCSGNSTNTPNDLTYGTLLVMPYRKPYENISPNFCAQIFIPNGDVSDPSLFYRTSLENTWNEWKRSCDGGNADLIDNKHSTDFIQINSINNYDCDSIFDAGLYLIKNGSNTPSGGNFGSLLVMPYRMGYGNAKHDFVAQIFIPAGDASDPSLFYRTSLENTWNEWKRSCDGGNADTANYATTAGDASTVNGARLMIGTREPQVEEPNALAYVPEGAWYGQYT